MTSLSGLPRKLLLPWVDWNQGEPPYDREGRYLVWLTKESLGSKLQIVVVRKCSNGFLKFMGSHFMSDILDKERQIVAWCEQPEGPEGL